MLHTDIYGGFKTTVMKTITNDIEYTIQNSISTTDSISMTDEIITRHNPVQPSDENYESLPCATCSNNPKNGGSGICNCILGQKMFY